MDSQKNDAMDAMDAMGSFFFRQGGPPWWYPQKPHEPLTAMTTVCLSLPFHDRRRCDRATVLCDAVHWVKLSQYHWVVLEDKLTGQPSYVMCNLHLSNPRSLHRECYVLEHGGIPSGKQIDHVNRIRTDCRSQNLRPCSASENACNRKKVLKRKGGATTSTFKGVWRKKPRTLKSGALKVDKKPWVCEVSVKEQGKKHTSCHKSEKDAARKYNEVAKGWMGDFCVLNVMSDDDEGGASGSSTQQPVEEEQPVAVEAAASED